MCGRRSTQQRLADPILIDDVVWPCVLREVNPIFMHEIVAHSRVRSNDIHVRKRRLLVLHVKLH